MLQFVRITTFLLMFFLNLGTLASAEELRLTAETEPLASAYGCVNVMSGDFFLANTGLDVLGPSPLSYTILYDSGHCYDSPMGYGIGSQFPLRLDRDSLNKRKEKSTLLLAEREGFDIPYAGNFICEAIRYKVDRKLFDQGYTNYSEAGISARNNIKNRTITYSGFGKRYTWGVFEVVDGCGTRRYYEPVKWQDECSRSVHWRLKKEIKPNGHKVFFEYGKVENNKPLEIVFLPTRIKTTNSNESLTLNSIELNFQKDFYEIRDSYNKYVRYCLRKIKYYDKQQDETTKYRHLTSIIPSHDVPTTFWIDESSKPGLGRQIKRQVRGDGRFLDISYGKSDGKVIALRAPVGLGAEPIQIASFKYPNRETTEVYDAYNCKTIYRFPKRRITAIEKYSKDNTLFSTRHFVWGESGFELGFLKAKGVSIGKNAFVNYTIASYDDRGNIVKEEVFGNFTGTGVSEFTRDWNLRPIFKYKLGPHKRSPTYTKAVECYTTEYVYSTDGFNLPVEEHHSDGKRIFYHYQAGTNLLSAKLTGGPNGIVAREFHEYTDGILTKTFVDDGSGKAIDDYTDVTIRKVTYYDLYQEGPCIGFPFRISQNYYDPIQDREYQLSRVENDYSPEGRLIKQVHYDANHVERYTLEWKYDQMGNVIEERNALGHVISRQFDANKNMTVEELVGSGYSTHYTYDFADRPIKIEEKHLNGPTLTKEYSYDYFGNRTAMVDPYGHRTTYVYDEFGRDTCVTQPLCFDKEGLPVSAQVKKAYNILGQVTAETDAMNATTKTSYNVRGQPTLISYPDESQERFEYYLNGTLAKKWDKSGLCTCYEYDTLQRIVSATSCDTTGNPIKTTRNVYHRGNLIQVIDSLDNTTNYVYDADGRKIEESKEDATGRSKTSYEYDLLGNLSITQQWINDHEYTRRIEEFDYLNHVIEMRIEDQDSKLLKKERYTYDIAGNKTHTYVFTDEETFSLTKTEYDSQRRPIQQVDALGHTTSIQYDYVDSAIGKVLCKTTTDPLGNQTVELHDPLGRVASTERRNAQGQRTAFEEVWYDANGRKVRQKEQVLTSTGLKPDYTIDWDLDSMGRILSITEQGGDEPPKITRFKYDIAGRLATTIKPDGVHLSHTYDPLGRLLEMTSLDQSTGYRYTYDANDNVLCVEDLLTHKTTTRTYDAWNHVLTEHLANELSLKYGYDALGRPIQITLPDGSYVCYWYEGTHLVTISRYSTDDTLLYQHTYSQYDLKGQAKEIQLIGNAGKAELGWDVVGRRIALTHPLWSEQILPEGFDAAGNLIYLTTTDPLGANHCSYQYDDLYQLIEEQGPIVHSYAYDSVKNRLKKDWLDYVVNGLNQVTSDSALTYGYDLNGNLISQSGPKTNRRYTYDALNRLVTAEETGCWKVAYTYDSFGRRLSRTLFQWQGEWVEEASTQFLYQNQREVGAFKNGLCTQYRVLGLGKGAELGAAVALELAGNVYAPLHDHRGNVCCLLDSISGKVAEFYRYSAYGEEQTYSADTVPLVTSSRTNPWLFASKRLDPHTRLIQFGKRDYNSNLGRWLTPDPLGFADGPNLYTYVQNNPLALFDPWGLSGLYDRDRESSGVSVGYRSSIGARSKDFGSERPHYCGAYCSSDLSSSSSGSRFGYFKTVYSLTQYSWNHLSDGEKDMAIGGSLFIASQFPYLRHAVGLGRLYYTINNLSRSSCFKGDTSVVTRRIIQESAGESNTKNVDPQRLTGFSSKQITDQSEQAGIFVVKEGQPGIRMPSDPNSLGAVLPRGSKEGYYYLNENMRIRAEQHSPGVRPNPRHDQQHYHVEWKVGEWQNNADKTIAKPPGYVKGDGTGLLPGETFFFQ